MTVNLALAMAGQGLKVGVVDADIYGHSVPAMLGVADSRPTQVDDLIMPVPTASGVSVISIGMLKPRRDQVVAWRGPMLDRALVQMLADVYWGDLDVLLLDLPPGTGDVAISLGQHLPGAEVVVVTTPQEAAAEVAERAGTMASMMHQRVVGVVENMSFLPCPHCAAEGTEHRLEIFGSGGGDRVAATLSKRFGYDVPVLGQDPARHLAARGRRRRQADRRRRPDRPGRRRARRDRRPALGPGRGLAGMQLGLTPGRPALGGAACSGSGCRSWRSSSFVAVLVFGPDKLPELAKQAGGMLRKARQLRQLRARRAARRARPGVRRPRAARPRPAHDRAQAHHRGDGGGRGGRQARSGAACARSATGEVPPYDLEAT